jgi:hypothetical protein
MGGLCGGDQVGRPLEAHLHQFLVNRAMEAFAETLPRGGL